LLILEEIKPNLLPSTSLALGFFDGVHLGHQRVIIDAVKRSKSIDAIATVVTFKNHPLKVLKGESPALITSLDKKLELFEELGVQAAVLVDFSSELARMTAEDYLKSIIIDSLHPRTITIGYNHNFGADKKGNDVLLKSLQDKYNYELSVIAPITIGNKVVSSSYVRELILSGDTRTAAKLLGKPFSIQNTVVHGEKRGRILGFPTANLVIPDDIIAPKTGVYSGMVNYENEIYKAVINVGKRPTFGDLTQDLIEVHIAEFNKDIYGKTIEVSFIEKIRDERKFDSLDELKNQIQNDLNFVLNSELVF